MLAPVTETTTRSARIRLRTAVPHRAPIGTVALITRPNARDLTGGLNEALHRRLMEQDLALQLHSIDNTTLDRQFGWADWRRAWNLEGALVYRQERIPDEWIQAAQAANTPAIWCNHQAHTDSVFYDENTAAVEATRLLVELGHRHIAFASTHDESQFSNGHYAWRERLLGFRHVINESGCRGSVGLQTTPDDPRLIQMLKGAERATAFITPHRDDALAIAYAAARLGLSIPRDLSLVTFDHDNVGFPGLSVTTMRIPLDYMGASAVDLLLRRIALGQAVPSVALGYDDPTGSSVAPPPQ
ncbi:MAG: substrate-binding domain-containing protein [Planctomycetota bacterium]|jgi:DNA-binding LacI/PurR family transcriptional regulator|nr:substrate-binding domain-containing protein [Planctomycetota bacterium]